MTQSVSTRCVGYLKSIGGREVSTRELARSVGCKNTSIASALQASVEAGILSKRTTLEPAGLVTYWCYTEQRNADWKAFPLWMSAVSPALIPLRADAKCLQGV